MACRQSPDCAHSVSGAETRDPTRPDRAVSLPYKSVSPWGRTGCLPSHPSSPTPTRRVTCCFKRRHICWCHVGAWPTPSADHSSFTFTSLLIHIIFISACQCNHLSGLSVFLLRRLTPSVPYIFLFKMWYDNILLIPVGKLNQAVAKVTAGEKGKGDSKNRIHKNVKYWDCTIKCYSVH